MTHEGPSLSDLLAKAEESKKIIETEDALKKGEAEEAQQKAQEQGVSENLEKREASIAEEKSSSSEMESFKSQAAEADAHVEYSEREVAEIDKHADALRNAGMENEVQALYDKENAKLEENRQAQSEAHAKLKASEEQFSEARSTSESIVPPTMAETVTPEQVAAREGLEGEAYEQETMQEGDKVRDEAMEEYDSRFQAERFALMDEAARMQRDLKDNFPSEFKYFDKYKSEIIRLLRFGTTEDYRFVPEFNNIGFSDGNGHKLKVSNDELLSSLKRDGFFDLPQVKGIMDIYKKYYDTAKTHPKSI